MTVKIMVGGFLAGTTVDTTVSKIKNNQFQRSIDSATTVLTKNKTVLVVKKILLGGLLRK